MNAIDLTNPITEWENIIWTPDQRFRGKTVFCLASGPSMSQAIADKVKGHPTIVVNSTVMLAPWADVLFFTDYGWFKDRKDFVSKFPGLVVSLARRAKREMPDKVLRIKGRGQPGYPPRFPRMGEEEIQQGRTSGHTAVALAIAMGASRVALCGYDMQLVNGKEHHHDEYKGPRDLTLYEKEFHTGFVGWNAATLSFGVQIVNCTHGSAVKEFTYVDLDTVLSRCAR